jgi:hypothetical protein
MNIDVLSWDKTFMFLNRDIYVFGQFHWTKNTAFWAQLFFCFGLVVGISSPKTNLSFVLSCFAKGRTSRDKNRQQ